MSACVSAPSEASAAPRRGLRYGSPSAARWIAAISSSFRLPFYPANAVLAAQTEGVVPMGGAVEICFDRGPIFLDRDYRVRAVSAGVGHSPKTEYVIIDFSVEDEARQRIASARQVYRFLKQGSGLYPELDGRG